MQAASKANSLQEYVRLPSVKSHGFHNIPLNLRQVWPGNAGQSQVLMVFPVQMQCRWWDYGGIKMKQYLCLMQNCWEGR